MEDGGKLAAMFAVGFLLIMAGLNGRLGSILGAIIDPSSMQEGPVGTSGGSSIVASSSTITSNAGTSGAIPKPTSNAGGSKGTLSSAGEGLIGRRGVS
jgi:hypothetical protein